MSDHPVVIAGAGVAGLSAALALAKAGQPSLVLERAPHLSEFGAGLQLGPNATRRLKGWSALEPLQRQGLAPEAVDVFVGESGEKIVDLPLADAQARWGAPYLLAHRADLLSALAEAVYRHPLITVRLGCEVEGWTETGEGVRVRAAAGPELAACALIGADGVRSRVRAGMRLFDVDKPIYTGRTSWRALVPAHAAHAAFLRPRGGLRLSPGAHLVHYPLRQASVVNVVAIVEDEWLEPDMVDFWSASGDVDYLASRFALWSAEVRALIDAAPEWRRWPLYTRRRAPRWRRGRVALLGDAAHAMAPFLAQGAAQAIEDADALGQAFADHPQNVIAALRAYESARVLRANRVQALSGRQGRIYHLDGPLARARNLSMRAMGSSGMARAVDWLYRA